jgi:Raf kinase inhibitor-like YbhB/YbcL family protein
MQRERVRVDLKLTSDAFAPGGIIPPRHTCDGENISPPLTWANVPEEAQSLALIMDDPDAVNGPWAHWVLYNIPAEITHLPPHVLGGETMPWGGMQGRNDYGNIQYEGPCPPPGSIHAFYFRLFALDQYLDLAPGANRAQLLDAIEGHVIISTELIGRYGSPA